MFSVKRLFLSQNFRNARNSDIKWHKTANKALQFICNKIPTTLTYLIICLFIGHNCSVAITTLYGLVRPVFESRYGRNFLHPVRTVLGPIQPPIQWVPVCTGLKRPGRGVYHTRHLASRLKKLWIYTFTTLWVFVNCSWVNFNFTITFFTPV
jgi:hypothetical protein